MRALALIGCLGCLACSPPPLPPYASEVDMGVEQARIDAGSIVAQPDAAVISQLDGAQGQIDAGTPANDAFVVDVDDAWSPPRSDDASLTVDDAAGGLFSDADNF